jgi:hypothetical protein
MAELLRAASAAKKLDISVDRLYSLSRDGIIPTCYLGRMIRWDDKQLDNFIQQGGRRFDGGWKKRKKR